MLHVALRPNNLEQGALLTMSYLQNQIDTFKSNLSTTAERFSAKKAVNGGAVPSLAASKISTESSNKNDLKRKRPEPSKVVYSQPADTGTGRNIMTQVTYAIEHLKAKGVPLSLGDLLNYLSLQYASDDYKRTIRTILSKHEKIDYDARANEGQGSYSFRPVHNIKSAEGLLGFLQKQPTAQGLSVRELRDGWPEAEEAITTLEMESKLLVTRNKKDNHAKMVWPDDPSLSIDVDDEFQSMWHKIRVPDATAVALELEKEGLTPANKNRGIKGKPKMEEKKKKKARRGGKTTNTHMVGVLRDYSHLKR